MGMASAGRKRDHLSIPLLIPSLTHLLPREKAPKLPKSDLDQAPTDLAGHPCTFHEQIYLVKDETQQFPATGQMASHAHQDSASYYVKKYTTGAQHVLVCRCSPVALPRFWVLAK
jgi:hypothetical protein